MTAYEDAIEVARSVQAFPNKDIRVADRENSWPALGKPEILDDSQPLPPGGTAHKRDVITDKG